MKKLVSLVTITTLVLTGCGIDSGNENENQTKNTDIELLTDTNIEAVLTMSAPNDSTLKNAIGKFREVYPNVTFDVEWVNNDNTEEVTKNLLVEVMAGGGPDIIYTDPLNMIDYIENDYVMNLSDLMELDESFNKADFYLNLLSSYEYNGSLYELPTYYYYTQITINKKAPEAVKEKFDSLETVSILDMYELYLETDFEEICPSLQVTNLYSFEMGKFVDYATKTVNIDSEESIALLEKTKEIYDRDFKYEPQNADFVVDDSVTKDEALFYLTYGMNINYTMDYEINSYENPKALSTTTGEAVVNGYNTYGINSNSQNVALAWEFIKFINTDYYNVEGLDFKKGHTTLFTTNLNAPQDIFNDFMKTYYQKTKFDAKANNYTDAEVKEKIDTKYTEVKELTNLPVVKQWDYVLRDYSVVGEELKNYLEGKQTLDTTIENMKNRLYIQMNEQIIDSATLTVFFRVAFIMRIEIWGSTLWSKMT